MEETGNRCFLDFLTGHSSTETRQPLPPGAASRTPPRGVEQAFFLVLGSNNSDRWVPPAPVRDRVSGSKRGICPDDWGGPRAHRRAVPGEGGAASSIRNLLSAVPGLPGSSPEPGGPRLDGCYGPRSAVPADAGASCPPSPQMELINGDKGPGGPRACAVQFLRHHATST